MAQPTYEQLLDVIARKDQQIAQRDRQIAQLEAHIAQLEKRNAQLEKQNTQLQARIVQLEQLLEKGSSANFGMALAVHKPVQERWL